MTTGTSAASSVALQRYNASFVASGDARRSSRRRPSSFGVGQPRPVVRCRTAVDVPTKPPNAVKPSRYAPLPSVPADRVWWIDDVEGLRRATRVVRALSSCRTEEDAAKPPPLPPPCVGLDAEWKPGDNTPVALLQVATRDEVFLIDLLACAPRSKGAELNDAVDELLQAILWEEALFKLGFSFNYDLKRMKASYSHLKVWEKKCESLVDVKQLAFAANPKKTSLRCGLAVLTRQVLGCMLDKKEQCSDWSKRPLKDSQIAYAAADGYSLCLIFDKCLTMIEDQDDVASVLQRVVEIGEPTRGLPRTVKKVRMKAAKAAKKAAKRGGQGKPCQFARETAIDRANADIVGSLEHVGVTIAGGRKGAVELLSPGVPIRSVNDGRNIDTWANATSIFVSVGRPETRGPTAFWDKDGELYMRWDGAAFGALDLDVERVRQAKSAEVTTVNSEGEPSESALLFIRRPPGQYVFCGRLECVGTSASNDSVVALRLVDGGRLRSSDTFFQLIGCRLTGDAPEDLLVGL